MVKRLALVLSSLALAACTGGNTDKSSSSEQLSSSGALSSEAVSSSVAPISSSSLAVVSSSSVVSSSIAVSSALAPASSSSVAVSSSIPASSSSVAVSSASASVPSGDFDLVKGKGLYEAHCLECHGVVGAGSIKIPVPIKDVDYAGLMTRVDGGNMPTGTGPLTGSEYSPEQCVGDCAHQVAGYITNNFPGALDTGDDGELGFNGCADAEGAPAERAMRLLTRREYENSINDIFGFDMDLTVSFSPEGRDHGFTNNADIAQVTARHLDNYYSAASRVTGAVQEGFTSGKLGDVLGCSGDLKCVVKFIDEFGPRIFRRPLTEEEKTEYFKFFRALVPANEADGYLNHSQHAKDAIGAGLPALLMSPHFLYRTELGEQEGDNYRLTDHEMASLISYTFIGSTPDDALMAAANAGELRTKAQYKAHAERLLATARGQDQMAHFAVEWWDSGLELIGSKNPDFYATYDANVIQSMVGEMQALFKQVAFNSTGKFDELYNPGYAMLDKTLSEFYGVGTVAGDTFTKVINSQRGGILSFGAIAASKASTEESSPVKRGVFVREQLMCDPLPPLPRDVNIPNPDLDPTKPMRARFTEHSSNENCWACHKFFDDIGFAMEIFDASGKHRDQEIMYNWDTKTEIDRLDILTAGKVINIDGDDEHNFDDLNGLANIMATADSSKSCMTTQYYRYVMGYTISDGDQCAIKNLNKTFADSQFDIKTLLIGITQLDSFSLRK